MHNLKKLTVLTLTFTGIFVEGLFAAELQVVKEPLPASREDNLTPSPQPKKRVRFTDPLAQDDQTLSQKQNSNTEEIETLNKKIADLVQQLAKLDPQETNIKDPEVAAMVRKNPKKPHSVPGKSTIRNRGNGNILIPKAPLVERLKAKPLKQAAPRPVALEEVEKQQRIAQEAIKQYKNQQASLIGNSPAATNAANAVEEYRNNASTPPSNVTGKQIAAAAVAANKGLPYNFSNPSNKDNLPPSPPIQPIQKNAKKK